MMPPAPAARLSPGTPPAYSLVQAKRGEAVYKSACTRCHMMSRFSGTAFDATWKNRRVYDLFDIVSNSMPQDAPGSLSTAQYVDVVAYLLQLNGAAAGTHALSADADTLKRMRIGATTPSE